MQRQPKAINLEIGKRIKERRKALNLTREELSALVGYSAGFIQEVERGRSGLSSESMKAFSTALKLSTDSLIFGSNTDDASYISTLLSSVPAHKRPHIIKVIEEAVECCK